MSFFPINVIPEIFIFERKVSENQIVSLCHVCVCRVVLGYMCCIDYFPQKLGLYLNELFQNLCLKYRDAVSANRYLVLKL